MFQRVFGRDVTLFFFSAEETAHEVAGQTLARKGLENDRPGGQQTAFLTTGDPALFRELGERFLQLPLGEVEHVTVAQPRSGGRMSRHGGRRRTSSGRTRSSPTTWSRPTPALVSCGKTRIVLCTASRGTACRAGCPGGRAG